MTSDYVELLIFKNNMVPPQMLEWLQHDIVGARYQNPPANFTLAITLSQTSATR